MANFLENIFGQLHRAGDRQIVREVRGEEFVSVTGRELLAKVARIRAYLRSADLRCGDRCAILAPNSILWAAFDLAMMAEGVIVVPLYSRQAPGELALMLKDCEPRILFTSDAALGDAVVKGWEQAPGVVLFEDVLQSSPLAEQNPVSLGGSDLVTIIYTSGTSGEAKGVCLNVGNIDHMLACTGERLDQLMRDKSESGDVPDQVFHYLPFNFAGSWILLLSCLMRVSELTLSTDLTRLVDEIGVASPNYFLNVPTLLERVRRGVGEAMAKRGRFISWLFARAQLAWQQQQSGGRGVLDTFWLAVGRKLIFGKIRARFGAYLRALICGSAPLAPETQQFFLMLGIPILQVYGLTETTAICTMDDPRVHVELGHVGPAISGIEMRLGENQEILVRGPNIFPGYWNRVEETRRVLRDGWFHTGDQGEMNERGNWRVTGRIKNLIILNSGHNVAPEPIEEKISQLLPGAQQVVLVGDGRGHLCALIAGPVAAQQVDEALESVNSDLPHYRQIRNFHLVENGFTPENGLLTANGKLRRDAINSRYASEISAMYDARPAK
ncbi:MAG TPA: AMP-binding protein [Candidatus Dormibacteraeota bacterium]|nr:AMP-binding protein [Candidatus Dormibacteraeota bacterium]